MRKEVRKLRIRAITLGVMLALLTATQACVVAPAYPPPPPPYGAYYYEPYYGPYPYYAPFSFGFSYRGGGGWGHHR